MAHRLSFKDFLSFGVQLSLNETSANGFEDGPALGIKLGIGSTLNRQPMRQRTHIVGLGTTRRSRGTISETPTHCLIRAKHSND
jgi:hypothetical protein